MDNSLRNCSDLPAIFRNCATTGRLDRRMADETRRGRPVPGRGWGIAASLFPRVKRGRRTAANLFPRVKALLLRQVPRRARLHLQPELDNLLI